MMCTVHVRQVGVPSNAQTATNVDMDGKVWDVIGCKCVGILNSYDQDPNIEQLFCVVCGTVICCSLATS